MPYQYGSPVAAGISQAGDAIAGAFNTMSKLSLLEIEENKIESRRQKLLAEDNADYRDAQSVYQYGLTHKGMPSGSTSELASGVGVGSDSTGRRISIDNPREGAYFQNMSQDLQQGEQQDEAELRAKSENAKTATAFFGLRKSNPELYKQLTKNMGSQNLAELVQQANYLGVDIGTDFEFPDPEYDQATKVFSPENTEKWKVLSPNTQQGYLEYAIANGIDFDPNAFKVNPSTAPVDKGKISDYMISVFDFDSLKKYHETGDFRFLEINKNIEKTAKKEKRTIKIAGIERDVKGWVSRHDKLEGMIRGLDPDLDKAEIEQLKKKMETIKLALASSSDPEEDSSDPFVDPPSSSTVQPGANADANETDYIWQ